MSEQVVLSADEGVSVSVIRETAARVDEWLAGRSQILVLAPGVHGLLVHRGVTISLCHHEPDDPADDPVG